MRARGAATAVLAGAAVAVPLLLAAGSTGAGGPSCLGKPATIVRGAGDNSIQGTSRADVIVAGAGDDFVEAHGGADRVCGGGGNDLIFTGPSGDKVAAGGGSDEVHGVGGNDVLRGDKGGDSGTVPHQDETIEAGLYGGDGADALTGGPGVDRCLGEAGNDQLSSCEIP